MSGPKVVRIVTREEVMQICAALLARLDREVEHWVEAGRRGDLITGDEIAHIRTRRDRIAALLDSEEFLALQKQAAAEIAFLGEDLKHRRSTQAEIEATQRIAQRRLAGEAAALLENIKRSGMAVAPDVRMTLERVRAGQETGATASAALSRVLALLTPDEDTSQITDEQRRLAKELGGAEGTQTLAQWLAAQTPDDDPTATKIDDCIGKLAVEAGAETARPFVERAARIAGELVVGRRRLLADSLMLDVAAALRTHREWEALEQKLGAAAAELSLIKSPDAHQALQGVQSALSTRDPGEAEAAARNAEQMIGNYRNASAAAARRAAVLKALSQLGYEVREGMATAWAQGNRVVLSKASNPDYGVELAGTAAEGRVQLRCVGFGDAKTPRNRARDVDMESVWCSDLAELRKLVAQDGGSVSVEKALAVGEVPLRIVARSGQAERRESTVAQPKARKLE